MEEILLNSEPQETRYAQVKDGTVVDLIIERMSSKRISGNIYKGKIKNVLKNINSAFIQINESENGFIQIDEMIDNYKLLQDKYNICTKFDVNNLINETVIVQVKKEALGSKGARLTPLISIPGRYVVLLPTKSQISISKKISNIESRKRLKELASKLNNKISTGIIYRTSSEKVGNETIEDEINKLINDWNEIVQKFNDKKYYGKLYESKDLLTHAIFRSLDLKADRLIVDNVNTYRKCCDIYENYKNEHDLKINLHTTKAPLFEYYGIESEIENALNRKVTLPSGAYMFFEKTEAMHAVDINSGNSMFSENISTEDAILNINLEAAKEALRQIKIRNIGGIITFDFIDMQSNKSRKKVIELIKKSMQDEEAKWQILKISKFGTLQITRQRIREPLYQIMFQQCPHCNGSGQIKSKETVSIQIQRSLRKHLRMQTKKRLTVFLSDEVKNYISKNLPNFVNEIEGSQNCKIDFCIKKGLNPDKFEIV